MAPEKEVEYPEVFMKNHRSWFVILEFLPTNKGRVSTRSGKSGKVREFVRGSGVKIFIHANF